jgi:hypothetical protein
MKVKLLVAFFLVACVGNAGAVLDISAGPYFGMDIPVVNDRATSGSLYGLQAKVSLLSYLALGASYSSSSLGDVENTFFEGDPDEFTESLPGGDVTAWGIDAYFGGMGGVPGFKLYIMGSVGGWTWERDFTDEVSEVAWRVGPGVEFVLPMGLGFEGRGMFQIAPTDGGGSIKSFVWFIGANYHFFSLLK